MSWYRRWYWCSYCIFIREKCKYLKELTSSFHFKLVKQFSSIKILLKLTFILLMFTIKEAIVNLLEEFLLCKGEYVKEIYLVQSRSYRKVRQRKQWIIHWIILPFHWVKLAPKVNNKDNITIYIYIVLVTIMLTLNIFRTPHQSILFYFE